MIASLEMVSAKKHRGEDTEASRAVRGEVEGKREPHMA